MGNGFKETAHLKTDLEKYGENYDHIFKKDKPVDGANDLEGQSPDVEWEQLAREAQTEFNNFRVEAMEAIYFLLSISRCLDNSYLSNSEMRMLRELQEKYRV